MAKLRKSNRVIVVDDARADDYLKRGYDQIDENGAVIKQATGGKTVSVSEYNKLLKKLGKMGNQEELEKRCETLYEELEKCKEKAKDFAEKGKQLQEENDKLKKQLGQRPNKKKGD